jgi:hypothetical protein
LSLFLKIVFTFDKFQSFTGICKSWLETMCALNTSFSERPVKGWCTLKHMLNEIYFPFTIWSFFSLFLLLSFFFYFCFCCTGGYIVAFTKVLQIYQIYHTWIPPSTTLF